MSQGSAAPETPEGVSGDASSDVGESSVAEPTPAGDVAMNAGGAASTNDAPVSAGGAGGTDGAFSGDGGALSSVGGSSVNAGGAAAAGGASGGIVPDPASGPALTLSDYTRIEGPIELDAIGGNASGITWKPETDTFFIVANTAHLLYEYDAGFGSLLRTISIDNGPTDTEDVAYLGDNRFAVVVEDNEVYVVTIEDGATIADLSAAMVERYVVSAPPEQANFGFEGVTLRPDVGASGQFIVCQEGGGPVPIRVLTFERSSSAGSFSYADGTLLVDEPWDAAAEIGDVAIDLSAVTFDVSSNTLLVLSHESSRLLRVVPETGAVLERRDLSGSPQYEGVTLADEQRLVLVSEPNFVEMYQGG